MSQKYHVKPDGTIGICNAKKGRCPYQSAPHFESEHEAQSYLDKTHEGEFGLLSGLSNKIKDLEKRVEEIERNVLPKLPDYFMKEHKFEASVEAKLDILQSQLDNKMKTGEKFNNEEIAERNRLVEEVMNSESIKKLNTSNTHGSLNKDGNIVFNRERVNQHKKLFLKLEEKYRNVPSEGKAVISAGMPGAGKSYAIQKTGDINLSQYAIINSDDFKEMLVEENMVPVVRGLTPMECVSLFHEESSYLFDKARESFMGTKKNILLDMTCANLEKTENRINQIKNAGYKGKDIIMIGIKTDFNVAKTRTISRHKEGLNEYIEGKNNVGGRFVPQGVLNSSKPRTGFIDPDGTDRRKYPEDCFTTNEQVYELIVKNKQIGIKGIMYDNSVVGKQPERIPEKTFL